MQRMLFFQLFVFFCSRVTATVTLLQVASTMIDSWGVIPDYIGDGTSDQEELMTAICAGAGEGFGGVTCDGVVSGTSQVACFCFLVFSLYCCWRFDDSVSGTPWVPFVCV